MNATTVAPHRRVLIIDDNASIHADFKKILAGRAADSEALKEAEAVLLGTAVPNRPQRLDYEVVSAFQGQEGMDLVNQSLKAGRPFALAFIDIRMPPGWDGIETTRWLWTLDPDLQIVICSAYSDYSWDQMHEQLGSSDRLVILKKPFDSVEVLQLANALTEKWKLVQQSKSELQGLERAVAERTQALRTSNDQLEAEVRERRATEEVLRHTQEKLSHLLARSPAVLFSYLIIDGRLQPSWISESFQRFTGRALAEWLANVVALDYVEPEDRLAVSRFNNLVLENQATLQYRIRRLDGTVRWVRDDRRLLAPEAGRQAEVVGCWTDITEQRALEEQLRQSQKMESIGLLAGGVAHDFNNLLTVIHGNVELVLMSDKLAADIELPLRQVLAAADRAGNLTRQLLAFSRKQIMRSQDLDVNELVETLSRLLGRMLGEQVRVRTNLERGLPAVFGDRGMLEQVVMNLAVNARDAMQSGGLLTFTTLTCDFAEHFGHEHPEGRAGTFVCLKVADSGTGIAPQHLAQIFDPFFTTKEIGKGTGLGLATVYGVVKQHEGWVEVASEVGTGTTFSVYLPVSIRNPLAAAANVPVLPAGGGKETVLVVEDEPALRKMIVTTLERKGYRVLSAVSGAEALQKWSNSLKEVDLLLTDVVMPDGVTGWELAARFKRARPELRVLYMSGYNAEMSKATVSPTRDIHFLAKPFNIHGLAESVRACLDEVVDPPPPQS